MSAWPIRISRFQCHAELTLSRMPAAASRSLLVAVALSLLTGGCAASSALRRAEDADLRRDNDRAVVEYTNVLRERPNDKNGRLGLERAKLRASNDHFQRGRRLSATGKFEEALVEFELAAELNPGSQELDEALRETRSQLRTRVAVAREGKT